jgi:hypothetical protein
MQVISLSNFRLSLELAGIIVCLLCMYLVNIQRVNLEMRTLLGILYESESS